MHLLIENPGVAPVEAYTMLGVSTTRDCDVDGVIGQFGSGSKHAINLFLRAGIEFRVYCGTTRLEFFAKDEVVDDGLVQKTVQRVCVRVGRRVQELSWVVDFGAIDWDDLGMALRELISNAIDRTLREGRGLDTLKVEPTNTVRAKDGVTRVYVDMTPPVWDYYHQLQKRFLHFAGDPQERLLPKAARNIGSSKVPVIYRCGVFVREIGHAAESLYDYNFRADDIPIDECRNSSEYVVRATCARALRDASAEELVPVLEALIEGRECFERKLDPDHIASRWNMPTESQKKTWQAAWRAVVGDAVACSHSRLAELVRAKGYQTVVIDQPAWVGMLALMGIMTQTTILSKAESEGRERLPATPAAQAAVDLVWGWLEALHMTKGEQKPLVWCFREVMECETRKLGFQDREGLHFAEDHASGMSKLLLQTALEEVVHWVTGATDMSRDFQDFVLKAFVEVAA